MNRLPSRKCGWTAGSFTGNDLTNRGGNTTELLKNIPSVNVDIDGNITLVALRVQPPTAALRLAGLGSLGIFEGRAPLTAWSSSPTLQPA